MNYKHAKLCFHCSTQTCLYDCPTFLAESSENVTDRDSRCLPAPRWSRQSKAYFLVFNSRILKRLKAVFLFKNILCENKCMLLARLASLSFQWLLSNQHKAHQYLIYLQSCAEQCSKLSHLKMISFFHQLKELYTSR